MPMMFLGVELRFADGERGADRYMGVIVRLRVGGLVRVGSGFTLKPVGVECRRRESRHQGKNSCSRETGSC